MQLPGPFISLIRSFFLLLFLLWVFLVGPGGPADVSAQGNAQTEIMTFAELSPGMKGVARSVFQGYDVVEFPIEIIGLVPHTGPNKNMILAKVGGEIIESSGVMSGVSGSPVYIDGKLIGALSSSWVFSKEPIGGITPIEQMLDIQNQYQTSVGRSSSLPIQDIALTGMGFPELQKVLQDTYRGAESTGQSAQFLRQVTFPLAISGCSDQLFPLLTQFFQPLGFQTVLGGHIGLTSSPVSLAGADPFKHDGEALITPGSAVGVDLVSGDMSISAIGTVTYVQDDTVLAFGHPLFGLGPVEMPLVKAYVHSIIPSSMMSFKLASTTQTIGTVLQDNRDGIMATLARKPAQLPLTITVNRGADQGQARSYTYFLTRDPVLTPAFSYFALLNTLSSTVKSMGESVVIIKSVLQLTDHGPIVLENTYSSIVAVQEANQELTMLLGLLSNPFKKVYPESIDLTVTIADSMKVTNIQEVWLVKTKYWPGEEMVLDLILQPYQEPISRQKVTIPLPETWKEGTYNLTVSNQQWYMRNNLRRAQNRYKPRTFEQLLKLLTEEHDQSTIYLTISQARTGLTLRGEEYGNVPTSMMSVLKIAPRAGAGNLNYEQVLYKSEIKTDAVISGMSVIQFEIIRPLH